MISDRQLSILNAIVEDYVDLGQPIGSKTLIERHNLNVSPASFLSVLSATILFL